MSFEGKANRKLANGQNIEDSEKRKWPKGLSAPALELNTIIFKHVYWYMQLISGERLQDHWSSGFCIPFLAHLSRRLIGELIVYLCSVVRPSSVRPSVVHNFKDLLL